MTFDEQLETAERSLRSNGVLGGILRIVNECWLDNLGRYDASKGDDARTLGFTTAANISNRVLREDALRPAATVTAPDGWALIHSAGYELKIYKLPGDGASADPNSADWTSSNAKELGALANTSVTQLALFSPEAVGEPGSPLLRRLHLVHTADEETGAVTCFLGFPRHDSDGCGPWFAVTQVIGEPIVSTTDQRPVVPEQRTTFEEQPVPAVILQLRRRDESQKK